MRMSLPSVFLRLLAGAFYAVVPAFAHAEMPEFALPAGSVRQAPLLPFHVNGRPVAMQSFLVPQAVGEVAAKLVPQVHGSPMLMGLPDGMAISWSDKSWLWSIRLQRVGAAQTQGTLSGSDMSPGAVAPVRRPAWLPAQGRLAVEVSTRRALQQTYLFAAAPGLLMPGIKTALARCGWQAVSESEGIRQWERADARLDLVLVSAGHGSGLVLHLSEPTRSGRGFDSC
jgi:hypothetical protein